MLTERLQRRRARPRHGAARRQRRAGHENGRIDVKPVAGSEFDVDADLVLLAMGFVAPSERRCSMSSASSSTDRGNVWRDANWMTNVPGVFAAGDMHRGQSLIVWAIAEGRRRRAAWTRI